MFFKEFRYRIPCKKYTLLNLFHKLLCNTSVLLFFKMFYLKLLTKGQRHVLASVIVKDAIVTGRKSRILG